MATPISSPRASPRASARRCSGASRRRCAKITWNRAATARFLGALLSDPKPDVFFEPPQAPLSRAAFAKAVAQRGVALDRRTQWLYDDDAIYVNGEAHAWPDGNRQPLTALANARALAARDAASLSPAALQFLHDGYRHGFLHVA